MTNLELSEVVAYLEDKLSGFHKPLDVSKLSPAELEEFADDDLSIAIEWDEEVVGSFIASYLSEVGFTPDMMLQYLQVQPISTRLEEVKIRTVLIGTLVSGEVHREYTALQNLTTRYGKSIKQ